MKKLIACTVLASSLLLAGCDMTNEATRDVEGVDYRDPDSVRFYGNVDQFPNISVLCIDGVAFATTTRDTSNAAAFLVPELDGTCPK